MCLFAAPTCILALMARLLYWPKAGNRRRESRQATCRWRTWRGSTSNCICRQTRRADGLINPAISSSGFSIQDGGGRHFLFFKIYYNLFRFIFRVLVELWDICGSCVQERKPFWKIFSSGCFLEEYGKYKAQNFAFSSCNVA